MSKNVNLLYTNVNRVVIEHMLGSKREWFDLIDMNNGQTVIVTKTNHQEDIDKLESIASVLNEGFYVQPQKFVDPEPMIMTNSGQMHIAHKKGHDYYIFDLKRDQWHVDIRDSGHEEDLAYIEKIVLVGEGNALRDVRRWIKRQYTDGFNSMGIKDLEEIRRRSNRMDYNTYIVFKNGLVMDVRSMKLAEVPSIAPTELQLKVTGHKGYHVASLVKRVENRNTFEVTVSSILNYQES